SSNCAGAGEPMFLSTRPLHAPLEQRRTSGVRPTAAGAPASSRRPGGNSPALRLFWGSRLSRELATRFGSGRSAGGVFGQHVIRHYRPVPQALGQHLNSTLPSACGNTGAPKAGLFPHAITTSIDATAQAFGKYLITNY